jgi:hypothetical protein
VFCAACGYTLCGQSHSLGYRYYRHGRDASARCPLSPRPQVPASRLEGEVVQMLFTTLGNPAAIRRAVKASVPDCDRAMKRRGRLAEDLAGVARGREKVLSLVGKNLVTEAQAEAQLRALRDRESALKKELDRLDVALAEVPDEDEIRCYVQRIEEAVGPPGIFVYDDSGDVHPGGNDLGTYLSMTYADKRKLVHAVFDGGLIEGKPAGVYVYPDGPRVAGRPKKWAFKIRGRLDFELVMQSVGH